MHPAPGSDYIRVKSNGLGTVEVDGYRLAPVPPLPVT